MAVNVLENQVEETGLVEKCEKKKKNVEDYVYYVGSNKQASDFETTNEFMINYIKRTYTRGNDIAEALRNLEEPVIEDWKPKLKTSIKKNEDEKKRTQKSWSGVASWSL